MEMVDSIIHVMKGRRTDEYFSEHIWKAANEIANANRIDIILPNPERKTKASSKYQDCCVMSTSGSRSERETNLSPYHMFKVTYFEVMDKVLTELQHRFG